MPKSPINVVRFQNKVRALLGFRGENPIPTIDELRQALVIENDRPEWSFAGGEFLWSTFASPAAVALEQGSLALLNPAGSGMISVVRAVALLAAAQIVQVLWVNSDVAANPGYASQTTVSPRDSRWLGGALGLTGAAATRALSGTLTAGEVTTLGGLQFDRLENISNGSFVDRTYIIRPGYSLVLLMANANVAADFIVHGYERTAERGLPS